MGKNRIEAFSDGVIAIIITIMVLEFKAPVTADISGLLPLIPVFLSYVLSFVFIGIYWNNHHHMLQAITKVNGKILWANLHLLFWLSFVPFITSWIGANNFAPQPVAVYGFVLFMCGFAYWLLSMALISHHGKDSLIAKAVGSDCKEKLSLILYAIAIPIAIYFPLISVILYIIVAIIWFVPDSRIEKLVN
jgi:uncharacterized membrane protein